MSREGRVKDPLQVNLRWLVLLILLTVIVPTIVLTGVGIAAIVARNEALDLVFGVLVISFASSVIAGAFLLIVLARRGARLARIQETFLSHMGHELLTPLAGIRLHGQILEGQGLPEKARESLLAINKETERLRALVERILRWRQIRSHKHLYDRIPTTGQNIVEKVLEMLPESDSVRVTVRNGDMQLIADEDAVAEAIANLVLNGIKYAGSEGPIELIARTFGAWAIFRVNDRGPGMPEEQPERLFEPFVRVIPGQRADPGGSGLGLTIARQITHAHGGRLRSFNRPGGGASFTILLPLPKSSSR